MWCTQPNAYAYVYAYAYIYGGGCRGNTGQSDEVLTVRDTGQLIKRGDTSLVSRIG